MPPFYEIIDFYLLYYDNSYNFLWFSKLGFFAYKECNEIHITSSLLLGKQDGSKVEGNNLDKNVIFAIISFKLICGTQYLVAT